MENSKSISVVSRDSSFRCFSYLSQYWFKKYISSLKEGITSFLLLWSNIMEIVNDQKLLLIIWTFLKRCLLDLGCVWYDWKSYLENIFKNISRFLVHMVILIMLQRRQFFVFGCRKIFPRGNRLCKKGKMIYLPISQLFNFMILL